MSSKSQSGKTQFAVLIDPDKVDDKSLVARVKLIEKSKADYIFTGGSLLLSNLDNCVKIIKENTYKPVILFPGHHSHISEKADAILLLSLISGRNPEYLIGNHIIAAPLLYQTNLEIISTAYILIDGGNVSSVQYVSNTVPIPANKTDIAVATAIAGELIGNKLVYLEAGSGAKNTVSDEMISAVKSKISCPLIVGGGIKNIDVAKTKFSAGANIVVIGNAIETCPELIEML